MFVKQIELHNFRNYEKQVIDVQQGINVFFGNNAQGKTNILEAIYLCACARSHRTARDSDLIRHEDNKYQVSLVFQDQQGVEDEINISFLDAVSGDSQRTRSQRIVLHNGLRLQRIGDMMGLFHAVIFAPEDLMLVKEGPATRRRYIDLLISQVRPSYFVHLQQFSQYLAQRNKFLKLLRSQHKSSSNRLNQQEEMQMDVWNQALAEQAALIMMQRYTYIKRVEFWAKKTQNELSSGKEELNVKYKTVSGIDLNEKEKLITEGYLKKLKNMIYEDIERGITGIGPHRDDLELSLNGEGLKPYASQGQQRSTVLALKIAELHILREEIGESPVLLLDDVMSELDENRRDSLLSHIDDAQIFVTCTDAGQVSKVLLNNEHPEQDNESSSFSKHEKEHSDKRSIGYYHVEQGSVTACGLSPD